MGHISKVLLEAGYEVESSDLISRGFGIGGIDFLNRKEKWDGDIITNPPYNCFSSDTECYTKKGWKFYNELLENDEILSLNPENQKLEWSNINKIIIKKVNEELIHFNKLHLDILCTHDHRMFAHFNSKIVIKNDDLILAKDIRRTHYIPRTGYNWEGGNLDYFILPEILGHEYAQEKIKKEVPIKIENWLKFFGLWISDGYCRRTENSLGNLRKVVGIKQSIKTSDYVRNILETLPFSYKEYKDDYSENKTPCINFEINNEQLWEYLIQFGYSNEKFIPDFIKDLKTDLLQIFIDSYFFGDGSDYLEEGRTYRTISKKLAEDLQEIILKLGYLSHIVINKSYKTLNNEENRVYLINYNPNSIYNKIYYPSAKNNKLNVMYNGIVWCVNLEKNGIFLLRRNGKEFFSGNCAKEFVEKSLNIIPAGNKVAMFLKLLFLESKGRKQFFLDNPPKTIYVSSSRIMCLKNGNEDNKESSAVYYAWFVWEKGFKGNPIIKWIN